MTSKLRVLLVEDQMMLGFALKCTLDDDGMEVLGPFPDSESAMQCLDEEHVDVAVLDVNLGNGQTSAPVADILIERETPFFFLSGYGSSGALPDRFEGQSMLRKPAPSSEIIAELHRLTGQTHL